ncbi:MAG: hypothetical protein ACXWYM_00350 [Candidatus Binatia bacterium]
MSKDNAQDADLKNNSDSILDDEEKISLHGEDSFGSELSGKDDVAELGLSEEAFSDSDVSPLKTLGISDPFAGDPFAADLFAEGQPLNFAAPAPRPGFTQRFIRYKIGNTPDTVNIQKSRRIGWIPRRGSTVTKEDGNYLAVMQKLGGDSIIMVQGQVLCEMPLNRAEAFRTAQTMRTRRQNVSYDGYKGEGDRSGVPTYVEDRRTTSAGRVPRVGGDRNA